MWRAVQEGKEQRVRHATPGATMLRAQTLAGNALLVKLIDQENLMEQYGDEHG